LIRQLNPKQLEAQIDMSEFAAAMYIVKVTADGKQTEIKIMNSPEGYQSIISNARKNGWNILNVQGK